MSEPETTAPRPSKDVIVPEPPPGSTWRRAVPIVGIAWILLHIAIPLRYYRDGADVYDERFAWRMFSSVRVRQCALSAHELRHGSRRALALMEILPAPWVALLERNRPAVVDRFLEWRCDREGVTRVELRNECRDATGDPLPPIEISIACDTGTITRGREEAPE